MASLQDPVSCRPPQSPDYKKHIPKLILWRWKSHALKHRDAFSSAHFGILGYAITYFFSNHKGAWGLASFNILNKISLC
jgi:hypothetical protein